MKVTMQQHKVEEVVMMTMTAATAPTKESANHKNQNKVHYVFLEKGHSYLVTT